MNKLIFFIFAFDFVFTLPLNEAPLEEGWYVPQVNGGLSWMTKSEAQKQSRESRSRPFVKFYLYTQSNPLKGQLIDINNITSSIRDSYFKKENPTRIIVHGWQNSYLSKVNLMIRNALLKTGEFNVISVDWSFRAQSINYPSAAAQVPFIGEQLGAFIDMLHTNFDLSFAELHLIGHSLGAHICGFAGKSVKYGKIRTIIGMDPALPLFNYTPSSERLCETDAFYVETIHTCAGLLGFEKPIGKASFYINGGRAQPGCGLDLTGSCAHQRSYMYYSEAILENNFPSLKCSTYKDAVSKSCDNTYSIIRMGSILNDQSAAGHYYVPVNKRSPYGKLST